MSEAGSIDLFVRETGAPASPAVVFLHGVGASGGMWAEHVKLLTGHHCMAPDLPGHGRSNHVPWISLNDTTEQVAKLIESRIPSGRVHVVGLSLGGAVAHTLLVRRPDLIDRAIIDGAGVLPAWWTGLMTLGVAGVAPFIHRKSLIGVVHRALGGDPSNMESFAADMRAASPRAFRRAFADANGTTISMDEVRAPCPTLFVAGEREPRAVRASNAALADSMPNAVARFAPGLGHGWLAQAPELHRRMVQAWICRQELLDELPQETSGWSGPKLACLLGSPVPAFKEGDERCCDWS